MTAGSPSYQSALEMIWARSAYDRGFISNPFQGDDTARLGLRRTEAVLEALGRPQDRFRILHVAGSKGKGSTCAFAASILRAHGRKTGRYTSPHLHSFRERIAVDGEPVSETEFAMLTARAVSAADSIDPALGSVTAFELLTAMALDGFARAGCDVAVVEVGLGGTLDATNVVRPAACLITALDYEHTRVLGDTLAEIAANKAGIIKPGVPVATAAHPPEARRVVSDVARRARAPWFAARRDWLWRGNWRAFSTSGPWGDIADLRLGLPGDHQVDNACLALAGCWLMEGDQLSPDAVRIGLRTASWPGRLEIITRPSGTNIVLDGAHTPAAAAALAAAYAAEFPESRPVVLLGILRDKVPASIAEPLAAIAAEIVAITPPGPRGLPAPELAAALDGLAIPVSVEESIDSALSRQEDQSLLVTGSLTTVAAAREVLGLGIADPAPVS